MLLQTHTYIVPKDKADQHARILRQFRAAMKRLGCDDFEVYEQVGVEWVGEKQSDRYVQILRFRDRSHYQSVQSAERKDTAVQQLVREFCELVGIQQQQEAGLFATMFYKGVLEDAAGG